MMHLEYRPYVCTVCGQKDKIQTNHEGPVLHYCKNCSWKRDFAGSENSHYIPALGNHTYRKFVLDTSVNENKNMLTESQITKVRNIIKLKECLNPEQKKKMGKLLQYFKTLAKEEVTGNVGGETDIANPDNFVSEDEVNMERNVVAKTFDTQADFDSYVNQHRGIEMTPKEQQAILGYKNAKPTQQDKFFVKYENTDEFGTNDTTVIKKMKEGNQFVWTAFAKHESAEEEGKPEGAEAVDEQEGEDLTVNDEIRIMKTITFTSDVDGANVLGDFLRKLDI
jgi:hypothetical protein